MRLKWLWLAPFFVPLAIACVGDEPATSTAGAGDDSGVPDASSGDSTAPADAAIDTGIVNVQTTFGEQTGSAHTGVTADTEIQWSAPALNFGADPFIVAHGSTDAGANTEIGLIHFDLSSLPTGSNVVDASLVLVTSTIAGCALAGGHKLGIYPMNQAWVAGSADGDAGVANYTNAQASTPWQGLGVTPPSRADAATIEVNAADSGIGYEIPITSLVQNWITSPSTNFGVALAVENVDDGVCFISSDSTAHPDQRPLLKITLGVAK